MTAEERRTRRRASALTAGLSALVSLVALATVRPWSAVVPIVLLMLAANAITLWAAWKG